MSRKINQNKKEGSKKCLLVAYWEEQSNYVSSLLQVDSNHEVINKILSYELKVTYLNRKNNSLLKCKVRLRRINLRGLILFRTSHLAGTLVCGLPFHYYKNIIFLQNQKIIYNGASKDQGTENLCTSLLCQTRSSQLDWIYIYASLFRGNQTVSCSASELPAILMLIVIYSSRVILISYLYKVNNFPTLSVWFTESQPLLNCKR